ncbi:cytochrome P450 [Aspergillus karnatakaensis]|uniref:cytochrome P450 n=1 Tax=Aspergillus karnatakaensis TaxID=1810916 RepID=UPI003CCE307B
MDVQSFYTPEGLTVIAAIAGLTTYIFHFHRGEHHLYPQRNIKVFLTLYLGLLFTLKYVSPTANPFETSAFPVTIYLFTIIGAMTFYRIFLNPLNKFPSNFLARLTSFSMSARVFKENTMYLDLYADHKKWGKIIRFSPNDISVSHPDAIRVSMGPTASCGKGTWYDYEQPSYSIHSARSRKEHDPRRRIWSPAFSDKALRGYEERVVNINETLVRQIDGFNGKPLDISTWIRFWAFDAMGDLAFGKSFHMLESAKSHWAIDMMTDSGKGAALAFPSWFVRLLMAIPGAKRAYYTLLDFCAKQIDERMSIQGKQANPDITHFLIEHYLTVKRNRPNEAKAELQKLHLDSRLVVLAGSDTTSAVMAFLLYHIAKEPGLLGRLRAEIEGLIGDDAKIENRKVQAATLLNACINETMRLHPAVPSGLYRKTPAEGVHMGGEFIPGNTTFLVNFYAMGRDEDNFAQADEFIPERFSTRPELVKEKDAFAPFWGGPFGCLGKNLALMEIRLLTAILVTRFDIELAPGEVGSQLLASFDVFTPGLKPCQLVFKRRVF